MRTAAIDRVAVLKGALVEFLIPVGDRESEHFRESAGGLELAHRLVPGLAAAQMQVERLDPGVPANDGGIELE